MKTVLLIILPYPSHYNASFGLAREFRNRGFRVVYTGYPYLKNHIEKQGYEFCKMDYATENVVHSAKGFISFFLRSLLDKKYLRKRYRTWYKDIINIREIYEDYQPEQIFLDAHLSHYYLYLIDHSKAITILSTKLSMKKSPGLPPLNSFYVPKDTLLSKLICELLWTKHTLETELVKLKKRLAFLNKDETYFQKRLCKKHRLRWDDIFEEKNTAFIGLKNVPTIILGSEKLEFTQKKSSPNEIHINLPIQRNEEKYFSEEYVLVRNRIEKLKNQPNYHVIYCSFGTLSSLNFKRVARFTDKLINALHEQENIALVISTGNLNIDFRSKGDHIFLLKQVPQLDVLSYSDMMITHGGHNSIKECLQAQVPMLVYPLNTKVDQPGNAVRVYIHEYGLFGKLESDTPKVILSKINGVLGMKKNIQQVGIVSEVSSIISK